MDAFVSKLRSTVSQVAYQVNTSVNTIIPGNLIHREYETLRFRCTYGSPGLIWSVFDAVKRDTTSIKASLQEAIGTNLIPSQTNSDLDQSQASSDRKLYSVFLFDKSQLENTPRSDRDAVLEHIKRGVTQLTRLRHPAILTVHHPLEESRSSLAFVTEHVFGHVDSILKDQRGRRVEAKTKQMGNLVDLSQDLGPKDSDYQQGTCQLDEIQIKAGLLQVCDGLKFLHNSAKILHRNLCLENVFVDSNNTWKIAGFEFSSSQSQAAPDGSNAAATDVCLDIVEFTPKQINSPLYPSLMTTCKTSPSVVVPNWSCSAPEHSNASQVTLSSDIYSLGIVSCALLGKDADLADLSYEYGLMSDTYKRGLRLRELADRLPANFKTIVMKYAAINAESRPSLDDYQNLAIFADQQVQAIRDLDSQFAWDRLRKIDFFIKLRDILPCLSHQVKVNRIAQSLFQDFVDPEMIPHVLPNILIIARDSTPTEFKTKIFPNLKPAFRILEPKSVPNMLLDNLDVLGDRARNCLPEFQQSAFTLIKYLLKLDQQMQEKCLTVLPRARRYLDEKSLNDLVMPELKRLHKDTTTQSIRVRILDCLKEMMDVMNQRMVTSHVIPLLLEAPVQEPSVVAATTSLVKMMCNCSNIALDKEIISKKLLPLLTPLTSVDGLSLQQFDQLMLLIKQLLDRIERQQREVLSRKSKVINQKSNALILDSQIVHFQ